MPRKRLFQGSPEFVKRSQRRDRRRVEVLEMGECVSEGSLEC